MSRRRPSEEYEPSPRELLDGLVVGSPRGGEYPVGAAGEITLCRLRKRLMTAGVDRLQYLATGDRVRFFRSPEEPERGRIDEVLPRTSELSRGRPGKPPQLIVVNLDQVLIVAAVAEPDLSLHRLDRFLILADCAEIEPLIILNKLDLDDDGTALAELAAIYEPLGYRVLGTSAETGEGLAELQAALTGRVSAVVGVSGAGKSTLLNTLDPSFELATQEVMDIGKGRHTTTASSLLPLACGGWVADTPGIKTVSPLPGLIPADELAEHFGELEPFVGACQFNNCTHRAEPGCQARAALAAGEIAASRFDSYLRLYEELRAAE